MLGLMQSRPLLISNLIEYAATRHADVEVVSHVDADHCERTNWRSIGDRSRRS